MKLEKYKEPIKVCVTGTKRDSFFGFYVSKQYETPLIKNVEEVEKGDVFHFVTTPNETFLAVENALKCSDEEWGIPCNPCNPMNFLKDNV